MTNFNFDREDPALPGWKGGYDTIVAVRVPRTILERVSAFQRQHGVSRSAALREIITKGVDA